MAELISVVAEHQARPGKEQELRDMLLSLVEPTRQEEGCVQYDLHVDLEDPGRFVFYENWTSHEALARHAGTAHIKRLRAASNELLDSPARVALYRRIA